MRSTITASRPPDVRAELDRYADEAADLLVSGDRDLLDLGEYAGTAIVSSAGFWPLEHQG